MNYLALGKCDRRILALRMCKIMAAFTSQLIGKPKYIVLCGRAWLGIGLLLPYPCIHHIWEGSGLFPCVLVWPGGVTSVWSWVLPSSPPCHPVRNLSLCVVPCLAFCMPPSQISRSRLQVCILGKTSRCRTAWLYLSGTWKLRFAGIFDHFECQTTWREEKKRKIKQLKSKYFGEGNSCSFQSEVSAASDHIHHACDRWGSSKTKHLSLGFAFLCLNIQRLWFSWTYCDFSANVFVRNETFGHLQGGRGIWW